MRPKKLTQYVVRIFSKCLKRLARKIYEHLQYTNFKITLELFNHNNKILIFVQLLQNNQFLYANVANQKLEKTKLITKFQLFTLSTIKEYHR